MTCASPSSVGSDARQIGAQDEVKMTGDTEYLSAKSCDSEPVGRVATIRSSKGTLKG